MFDWFLQLSFFLQFLIVYLFFINFFTFLTFGVDKRKSQTTQRRIRERTLWICTLVGGSPGALLAMNYFRHKTKKLSFQSVVILILCLQIAALFFLYKFLHPITPEFQNF